MLKREDFKFGWIEFSGSLGDLGLFIPLVVAMTITVKLDLGLVLIMAGLLNVLTGIIFKLPIPVQPMKAIAAVAITEQLVKEELIAAGILMGIILLVCSLFVDSITRTIPKTIVRGIQLGIGLKLMIKGVQWIGRLPFIGIDSIIVALFTMIILFYFMDKNLPVLVFVFIAGFILLFMKHPQSFNNIHMALPQFGLFIPRTLAYSPAFYKGVLPQLPLTLLNSVVAVCALSADYFPKKAIGPKKMAASVGLMNLISVPLGGIPVCHGAGGLAAQYRFGARTGGSVIMLGALKVVIGLFFGVAIFGLLYNYPLSILGTMLIFAGLELSKSAKDVLVDPRGFLIPVVMAAFIIGFNTLIGFIVGCVLSICFKNKENINGS